jgi:hypothetical protein
VLLLLVLLVHLLLLVVELLHLLPVELQFQLLHQASGRTTVR